jgi:hypothetical protein
MFSCIYELVAKWCYSERASSDAEPAAWKYTCPTVKLTTEHLNRFDVTHLLIRQSSV